MRNKKICIIGAGNMGEVIINGLLSKKIRAKTDVTAVETLKSRAGYIKKKYGIKICSSQRDAVANAGLIILAVKPQIINAVLSELNQFISEGTSVVSIAAGITTKFIESRLPDGVAVVRVMPNTPCLVGEGISAVAEGKRRSKELLDLTVRIFNAMGGTVMVPEKFIDAVTAVSGSGPAFVLTMAEAMMDAGVKAGLPRNVARTLVVSTIKGTGYLMLKTGRHPADLKDMITSPGGTTIAGLHELEKKRFRATVIDAIIAASDRAKELSGQ